MCWNINHIIVYTPHFLPLGFRFGGYTSHTSAAAVVSTILILWALCRSIMKVHQAQIRIIDGNKGTMICGGLRMTPASGLQPWSVRWAPWIKEGINNVNWRCVGALEAMPVCPSFWVYLSLSLLPPFDLFVRFAPASFPPPFSLFPTWAHHLITWKKCPFRYRFAGVMCFTWDQGMFHVST